MGPYLWIDTGEVYRKSTYAQDELKIDAENFDTDLNDIPQRMSIKDETFVLCGVAKYIPPFDSNGMGHYVACY